MTWYIVIGIVLLILLFLLYFYNKRMRVAHLFITTYSIWYDETGSVDTALRKGIDNFTYRYPFNQLDEYDINRIVAGFSKLENPSESLAKILQYTDRTGDVNALIEYVVITRND